jgi:hypothetical protein
MSDNKLELTREWFAVKNKLDAIKAEESELRKAVVEAHFGENLTKGTKRSEIKPGVNLILSVSEKVSLDPDAFKQHKAELQARGFIKDEEGLIKTKYEVSASALKHLSDSDKAKFGGLFVHKLESPQVKIEVKETPDV